MKSVYVYDEFGVEYRVVNSVAWRDRVAKAIADGVVGGFRHGEVYDSEAYSAMIRRASADGVLYAEYGEDWAMPEGYSLVTREESDAIDDGMDADDMAAVLADARARQARRAEGA